MLFRRSSGVPVGSVVTFAADAPLPKGFIDPEGAAISRSLYAKLFAVIGTTYGAGDGATTFNLPDFRGVFFRGLDSGRGLDTGRVIGVLQGDAIRNITGDMTCNQSPGYYGWNGTGALVGRNRGGNGVRAYVNQSGQLGMAFDASLVVPTAAENRPINEAVKYGIKF